jgi:hypothetical protein
MPTLNWHKREEAVRAATRAPYRLLEPVAELSYGDADSENLLIQGDNLDALKALLPYYAGGVKCVAGDPPYSTLLETYERRRRSISRLADPTNPRPSVEGSGTTLAVNWKLSNASPWSFPTSLFSIQRIHKVSPLFQLTELIVPPSPDTKPVELPSIA